MKKLAVSMFVFVLMLLPAVALAEVNWVPPTITPVCAPDAEHSAWSITLAKESNYNFQWADNAGFTSPTQVAGVEGFNSLTTPRIERIWVRWASDHNSKSDAYWTPKGCAPEPPKESSSLSVTGECNADYVASYKITNNGGDMFGPSTWYQSDNWTGGASSCAANVAAGYDWKGTITLAEGQSINVAAMMTPGAMCLEQRPWHPGTGWTHAAIETACEPPPPPPCSNFPDWTEVHDGWMRLEDGTCVEKPEDPQDQCPDLEGFQPPMPPGWYYIDGKCKRDQCDNIADFQATVPEGMQQNQDGDLLICQAPTALDEVAEVLQQKRIYLPFLQTPAPINFQVWRRCISGQVTDVLAKNLPFLAVQETPAKRITGTTNGAGQAFIDGLYFTIYLGPGDKRQEAGDVWYDPNAVMFKLYYVDDGC